MIDDDNYTLVRVTEDVGRVADIEPGYYARRVDADGTVTMVPAAITVRGIVDQAVERTEAALEQARAIQNSAGLHHPLSGVLLDLVRHLDGVDRCRWCFHERHDGRDCKGAAFADDTTSSRSTCTCAHEFELSAPATTPAPNNMGPSHLALLGVEPLLHALAEEMRSWRGVAMARFQPHGAVGRPPEFAEGNTAYVEVETLAVPGLTTPGPETVSRRYQVTVVEVDRRLTSG